MYDEVLTDRLAAPAAIRVRADVQRRARDVELEMCPKPVADEASNHGNVEFPVPLVGTVFSGRPMGKLDGRIGLALDPGGCVPWHLLEN